jgi:exonuclease III
MDMRFGTWNIRSLHRAGSLVLVSKELSKYKLDLVGVQEIRWVGISTKPAGEYTSFYGKGNENYELGTGSLCIRDSYQQLRGLSLIVIGCHT